MNRKIVAGVAAAAAVAGAAFWTVKTGSHEFSVPVYKVARVIDEDTFETTEKQLIRLDDINSPEIEFCGGPEAKAYLEKLILNKYVYLKVNYRDPFQRLDSYVYNLNGSVNKRMLESGNAIYRKRRAGELPGLKEAAQKASENKKGIFPEFLLILS